MVIDVHAHIILPEILREAAPAEEWRPRVMWESRRQIIEYGEKRIASATREFVSAEKILEEMARVGVNTVVLCPWVSLLRNDAPAAEALAICQIQNDALAALTTQYPGRIAALGFVPLQDVSLAVTELERLMRAGLKGVEIGTHVHGIYPGDARFRSFWEACQALDAVVFIHPAEGGGRPELRDYYMWNVIGNPMETTVAAGHLVLSGVMDIYPRLKILLAHGGGALPYLRGRLERGFHVRPEISRAISQPPTEYFKRFYYDTITHDPAVLRGLVDFVGADHVLLGSDYPFDMGNEDPVAAVKAAKLQDEAKILGDTAGQLFNLQLLADPRRML